MKKILWLFLLILPFTGIYGQTANLTFLVSDSITGKTVDSVQVVLGNTTQWTNPNGVASFTSIARGTYTYVLTARGYDKKLGSVVLDTSRQVVVKLRPLSSCRVTFTLLNPAAKPIVGATVALGNSFNKTDSLGVAVFSNQASGTYSYTVSQTGFVGITKSLVVGTPEVRVPITLNYSSYTANFIVKDNLARPIRGASIVVDSTSTLTTDSLGRAVFVFKTQNHNFKVSAPGFQPIGQSLNIAAGTITVPINLVPQSVYYKFTLIVKDNLAKPIKGATVILNNARTLMTDSLGRVVFGDLSAQTDYLLEVSKPGFQRIADKFRLVASDSSKTVVMQASYKLSFYVRDMQKMPVRGARILLDGTIAQLTDSLGMAYYPEILANTTHSYVLSKSGYYSSDGSTGVILADKMVELWITAQTYNMTFVVTDNGKAVRAANVSVDQQAALLTDSLGRVTVMKLAKGVHQYKVSKAGYTDVSGSASIDTLSIVRDIKLIPVAPPVKLTIIVRDDLGRFVKGASVRLDNVKYAVSDSLGRAVFTDVAANVQHSYDVIETKAYYWGKNPISVLATDLSVDAIVKLKTYNITFKVAANGAVVKGASVVLDQNKVLTTDSLGRAVFSGLYLGIHAYKVSKAGYTDFSGNVRLDSVDLTPSINLLPVQFYKLTFYIYDDRKQPMKAAQVVLDKTRVLMTDSLGRAVFADLAANSTHTYSVMKAGYITANNDVVVGLSDQYKELYLARVTYPLSVSVKDSLGAPIMGATAMLDNYITSYSDSLGRINLNASAGTHVLNVTKLGYSNYSSSISVDSTGKSVEVRLSKLAVKKLDVTVKVFDANKMPIKGALVVLNKTKELLTDSLGVVVFRQLEGYSQNSCRVSKAGYATQEFGLVLTDVNYSVEKYLSFAKYDVLLTVRNNLMVGLKDALVSINGGAFRSTDLNGNLTFTGLSFDKYTLSISKAGFVARQEVLEIVKGDPRAVIPFNITLQSAPTTSSISFVVKDVNGAFVPNATIALDTAVRVTNPDGRVTFYNLAKGVYKYVVSKDSYRKIYGSVYADSTTAMVNVTLRKYTDVSFVVKDANAKPILGALVMLSNLYAKTDSAGRATFVGVETGNVAYKVSLLGFADVSGVLNLATNVTKDVVLNAKKVQVRFVVYDESGKYANAAQVAVGATTKSTDANGNVTFSDLSVGSVVEYKVSKTGYNTLINKFILMDSLVTKVVISPLNKTYTFAFRVLKENLIAAGADIKLNNISLKTDNYGNAKFTNLLPGSYSYLVSLAGCKTDTGSVTITNYDQSKTINLLSTAKRVNVTFVFKDSLDRPWTYVVFTSPGICTNYYTWTENRLSFKGIPSGTYTFTTKEVSGSFTIGETDATINILRAPIPTRNLNFQITDFTTNQPIGGAYLNIDGKVLQTNEDGWVRFDQVVVGYRRLYIVKEGFSNYFQYLMVKDTSTTYQLKLRALPSYSVIDFGLSNNVVSEGQSYGKPIGKFSVTNPQQSAPYRYSIAYSDTGKIVDNYSFYIKDSTLYTSSSLFDFEKKNEYKIRVNVTDVYNRIYKKEFVIKVADVNEKPEFISNPIVTARANEQYSYAVSVVDPEKAGLTISAKSLPTWLSLSPAVDGKATLSGTPTVAGSYTVALEASDGSTVATQAYTLKVAAGVVKNNPPQAYSWWPVYGNDYYTDYTPCWLYAYDDIDKFSDLYFEAVGKPAHASDFYFSKNVAYYKAEPNWYGTDTIAYRVRDSYGAWSNTAKVVFYYRHIEKAPVVKSAEFNADGNTRFIIDLAGVVESSETPKEELRFYSQPSKSDVELVGLLGGSLKKVSGTIWEYTPGTNNLPVDYISFYAVNNSWMFSAQKTIKISGLPFSNKKGSNLSTVVTQPVAYDNAKIGEALTVNIVAVNTQGNDPVTITPSTQELRYGTITWMQPVNEMGLTRLTGTYIPTVADSVEVIPFVASSGAAMSTADLTINIARQLYAPDVKELSPVAISQTTSTTVAVIYKDKDTPAANMKWVASTLSDANGVSFSFENVNDTLVNLRITSPSTYSGELLVTVTATDPNGQESSQSFICTVDNTTGIEDQEPITITMYPNPNNGRLTVDGTENASLVVYDLSGKVVLQQSHLIGSQVLNLSSLADGTYFVKIVDKNKAQTQKIIIRK